MKVDSQVNLITNSSTVIYSYADEGRCKKLAEMLGMEVLVIPKNFEDCLYDYDDVEEENTELFLELRRNDLLDDMYNLITHNLRPVHLELMNKLISAIPDDPWTGRTPETFAMFFKDGEYQKEFSEMVLNLYDHDSEYNG